MGRAEFENVSAGLLPPAKLHDDRQKGGTAGRALLAVHQDDTDPVGAEHLPKRRREAGDEEKPEQPRGAPRPLKTNRHMIRPSDASGAETAIPYSFTAPVRLDT
jgi:hypothetical protein